MNEIEKVIQIAMNEVGYLEKETNNQLEDKERNAGNKNYTKYGKAMGCNGSPWCDAFVDWCFVQSFGAQRAKELLNGFSNYTPTSAQYFKNKNQWFCNPAVGDIVFFRNGTRICHTGIVHKVENGVVYTIEGNTSSKNEIVVNGGCVCCKSYKTTNSRISGYGRPLYQKEVNKNMMHGIDISSHQGAIDFEKVKKAGVEFIVIRSTTKNNNPDVRLAEYVKGCHDFDIPFSFYKYMYSLSEDSARIEATKAIWAIENVGVKKSKDVVIYADVEDKSQFALSTQKLTKIVSAFKEVIENNGYTFGLYMSKSPYENYEVDASGFNDEIWIARYPSSSNKGLKDIPSSNYMPRTIKGRLSGWQWSSKGVVDGIKGNVDLDIFYGQIKQPDIETRYYKTPEFTLIESLNKIGVYSSFANRKKIASANDIKNYTGTADQNLLMLKLLTEGRLKQI